MSWTSGKPTDTLQRITRIEELTDRIKGEKLLEAFKDEKGLSSINLSSSGSVFNIIMELKSKRALVTEETFWLKFDFDLV